MRVRQRWHASTAWFSASGPSVPSRQKDRVAGLDPRRYTAAASPQAESGSATRPNGLFHSLPRWLMRSLNRSVGATVKRCGSDFSIWKLRSGIRFLSHHRGTMFQPVEEVTDLLPDLGSTGKAPPVGANQAYQLVTLVDREHIIFREPQIPGRAQLGSPAELQRRLPFPSTPDWRPRCLSRSPAASSDSVAPAGLG